MCAALINTPYLATVTVIDWFCKLNTPHQAVILVEASYGIDNWLLACFALLQIVQEVFPLIDLLCCSYVGTPQLGLNAFIATVCSNSH